MVALDPTMVLADSNLTTALYGAEGQLASEQGQANAFNIEAQGANAEAGQYDIAGAASEANAQTELVSGQLQQFQNTRKLMMTLGSQTAGYAGSGFQASGSTLGVARSSLQQGLLQNQVLGVNADLAAGGYLEQAAASHAEAATARTAAAAATANATTATNLSNLTKANITATSTFLNTLPPSTDPTTASVVSNAIISADKVTGQPLPEAAPPAGPFGQPVPGAPIAANVI